MAIAVRTQFTKVGRDRDGLDVGHQCITLVDLDRPRFLIRATTAEHKAVALGVTDFILRGHRQRDHLALARHEFEGVHREIRVGVFTNTELHELAYTRITVDPAIGNAVTIVVLALGHVLAREDLVQRNHAVGQLAVVVFQHIDEVQPLARLERAEVDHDVIALRDGLHRQHTTLRTEGAVKRSDVLHDATVVRDHVHRNGRAIGLDQSQLQVTRNAAVQDAEAVAPRTHVEVGLHLPVGQQVIAEEAFRLEVVEPQLTVLVPSLVTEHQVHIVVAVTPRQRRAAG